MADGYRVAHKNRVRFAAMNGKNENPRVAVIGMGCWYPGARNLRTLWENILARRQQFRQFPSVRLPMSDYHDPDRAATDKTYGNRAAVVDGFEFDWAKRRIPKSVVESTDIVHWLALEVALQTLDDSGYDAEKLPRERTCVLVGNTLTGEHTRAQAMRQRWPYVRRALHAASRSLLPASQAEHLLARMEEYFKSPFAPVTEDTLAGGLSNTIAGRICNFLNLNGGGYTVDGACSSSLIAVANAAALVASGEMDVAIAGGVDVSLDTFEMIGFAKTGALTAGEMTVYDKNGSGFIPGEGCGFVMLKSLDKAIADEDKIYAVVRGWGISSDGKGGITAPKAAGQALALERAYLRAGYSVHDLDFIEGHGTGTAVGDKVELQGVALAAQKFGQISPRSIGMTSFKSLVGHTKAAAGVGGFIKAALAVNQRVIPPTVKCDIPHPVFTAEALGLYPVMQGSIGKKDVPMRAGVSAMGFGGINCHVTLESGPTVLPVLAAGTDEQALLSSYQQVELFLLSADTSAELTAACEQLRSRCDGMAVAELADLAAETNQSSSGTRPRFRASVAAFSPDDLSAKLATVIDSLSNRPVGDGHYLELSTDVVIGHSKKNPRVGFLYPGQGSQQLNMARLLVMRHRWAKELVDAADEALASNGFPRISDVMFKPLERGFGTDLEREWTEILKDTRHAQIAICLVSLLYTSYLKRLGIQPAAVAGHSLGELSALFACGALDARDLILLAAERGRAMAGATGSPGAMASLACVENEARDLAGTVPGYLTVACMNSSVQTVVSGEKSAIDALVAAAAAKSITAKKLAVSNAFHSTLIASATDVLAGLSWLRESAVVSTPFVSAVDGGVINGSIELRRYCSAQVQAPVRFVDVAKKMMALCDVALEVGPARALGAFVADTTGGALRCLPVESAPGADRDLLRALGVVFVMGADVDARALYEERLIRQFVPAAEKKFIDNPCERPFAPHLELGADSVVAAGGNDKSNALLSDMLTGVSPTELERYLGKRRRFLEQVIRADMDSAHPQEPVRARPMESANAVTPPKALAQESASGSSALNELFRLVTAATGFAAASLTAQLRLLDDLNLDSIKAGELIAGLAQRMNVAGKLDPAPLLNATLGEIADAVAAAGPERTATPAPSQQPKITAQDLLIERISQRTGFDAQSLHSNLRMLDDLNLDSIKVAELIAEVSKKLGAAGSLEPVKFANATLAEVAAALEAATPASSASNAKPQQPSNAPSPSAETSWVRNFGLELIDAPLAAARTPLIGKIVVVAQEASLATSLAAAGLDVSHAPSASAQSLIVDPSVAHLVVVLEPDTTSSLDTSAVIVSLQLSTQQPYVRREGGRTLCYVLLGPNPGVQAFAASVHLERPETNVRVIEFPRDAASDWISTTVQAELQSDDRFVAALYDENRSRRMRKPVLHDSGTYAPRAVSWNRSDVVLVTGGAKGITAECALAVARQHGVRMALVGSSQHSDSKPDAAIAETLARFAASNIEAKYYSCDISAADAVRNLVQQITADLGTVTGVIHGAGLNRPRRAESADFSSACAEIGPKLLGARHLLAALEGTPLKAFSALTSIIGVTGMAGNAWYAYSNGMVDSLVEAYRRAHPQCAAFTVAYSVWDEVGMGARMGSTAHLNKLGIAAIPPKEGVERFVKLWNTDAGNCPVVVAARLGGLDTWSPVDLGSTLSLRYIEDVKTIQPGVELVARVQLHPERDLYLRDHDYKGSLLFPTVFGMEAMAQAVARVLGHADGFAPGRTIAFETIELVRPIVVARDTGAWIELRAVVDESPAVAGMERAVRVGIRTEQTGWTVDHFSARIALGGTDNDEPPAQLETSTLAIAPKKDLYGPLLFQGPKFQRLQTVRRLEEEKEYEGETVIDVLGESAERNVAHSFSDDATQSMLLGDPYVRDVILQSGQLLIPQHLCLPIGIDKVSIRARDTQRTFQLVTRLHGRTGRDVTASCVLHDDDGRVVERLDGYRVRILETKPQNPDVSDLKQLSVWDDGRLAAALKTAFASAELSTVHATLARIDGLHDLARAKRRELAQSIAQTLWAKVRDESMPRMAWRPNGKPVFENSDVGVSISHDDAGCLVTIGQSPLGCDLAPISARTRQDWLALLGNAREKLLDVLMGAGDSMDVAGTRIWAAHEALIKAGMDGDVTLRFASRSDTAVMLAGEAAQISSLVLTLPFAGWGQTRIVAITTAQTLTVPVSTATAASTESAPILASDDMYGPTSASSWTTRDEQGVMRFHHRFNLLMDDVSSVSRAVSFSRYFAWMGKVRELALQPVITELSAAVGTGQWGAVTNQSDVRVYGEAKGSDKVVGVVQGMRLTDSDDSTIDLKFQWFKEQSGGEPELLASSVMRTSWVKVIGHGQVEKYPLPSFLKDFLRKTGETKQQGAELPQLGFSALPRGEIVVSYAKQFGAEPLLHRELFHTDQEDSNLVGNIYHSHYAKWQGRVFDRFLHLKAPQYFTQGGENGEWLTQRSRLNYLRDAMPFDIVEVEMRLRELTEHGATLTFSYYRKDENNGRTKLAQGEQEVVWTQKNADGERKSSAMPNAWRAGFLGAERKTVATSREMENVE